MKRIENIFMPHFCLAISKTLAPAFQHQAAFALHALNGFLIALACTFHPTHAADAHFTYSPIILDDPTPQLKARFGRAVTGLEDIDGDGIRDILVSANEQDVGETSDQGQAFIFSGATGAYLLTLNHPEPQESAFFGSAVAAVGDLNGDGIADIAIAAPRQNVDGQSIQGRVYCFSGKDATMFRMFDNPTPQSNSNFGNALADVGDIDGDQVHDLLISARFQDVGEYVQQGQAFVFSGADGRLLLTLDDPFPLARAAFGRSVARAGDIDQDGINDLLIGANMQDADGNAGQGQAFVFSGRDGHLLLTLNNPFPQTASEFGNAVSSLESVNGDSIPDLLVSARFQDVNGNSNQGQAFVFDGVNGALLFSLNNPISQPDAAFGSSVSAIGDINGDGVGDVLIGALRQTVNEQLNQGQAFLFSGVDGSLLYTLDNPNTQPDAVFGVAVAGLGDLNGDGLSDLVVSANEQDVNGNINQGQAFLFLSSRVPFALLIDIIPTEIDLSKSRTIPVAILSTADFDVAKVDASSVRFGVSSAADTDDIGSKRDVDGDGDLDLLFFFRTNQTGISCGDTQATLTGQTLTGEPFYGVDTFVTTGCP